MESEEYRSFYSSLRADFILPTSHTLRKQVVEFFAEAQLLVKQKVKGKLVHLAVDGWEDQMRCQFWQSPLFSQEKNPFC